jgi:hypothetical protein
MSSGVDIVAKIERTCKKAAAELLMKVGLSIYMGDKVTEFIISERAAREQNQKVNIPRFIREIRRLAREKGMDIFKFI